MTWYYMTINKYTAEHQQYMIYTEVTLQRNMHTPASRFHTIQVHITLYKQYSVTWDIRNKVNNGTYAHMSICWDFKQAKSIDVVSQ